jgi:hypothetical protein
MLKTEMMIHKKNEHLKQRHCIHPTGIFPIAKTTKLRVSQGMSAKKHNIKQYSSGKHFITQVVDYLVHVMVTRD